jgi:hypothetical protein
VSSAAASSTHSPDSTVSTFKTRLTLPSSTSLTL